MADRGDRRVVRRLDGQADVHSPGNFPDEFDTADESTRWLLEVEGYGGHSFVVSHSRSRASYNRRLRRRHPRNEFGRRRGQRRRRGPRRQELHIIQPELGEHYSCHYVCHNGCGACVIFILRRKVTPPHWYVQVLHQHLPRCVAQRIRSLAQVQLPTPSRSGRQGHSDSEGTELATPPSTGRGLHESAHSDQSKDEDDDQDDDKDEGGETQTNNSFSPNYSSPQHSHCGQDSGSREATSDGKETATPPSQHRGRDEGADDDEDEDEETKMNDEYEASPPVRRQLPQRASLLQAIGALNAEPVIDLQQGRDYTTPVREPNQTSSDPEVHQNQSLQASDRVQAWSSEAPDHHQSSPVAGQSAGKDGVMAPATPPKHEQGTTSRVPPMRTPSPNSANRTIRSDGRGSAARSPGYTSPPVRRQLFLGARPNGGNRQSGESTRVRNPAPAQLELQPGQSAVPQDLQQREDPAVAVGRQHFQSPRPRGLQQAEGSTVTRLQRQSTPLPPQTGLRLLASQRGQHQPAPPPIEGLTRDYQTGFRQLDGQHVPPPPPPVAAAPAAAPPASAPPAPAGPPTGHLFHGPRARFGRFDDQERAPPPAPAQPPHPAHGGLEYSRGQFPPCPVPAHDPVHASRYIVNVFAVIVIVVIIAIVVVIKLALRQIEIFTRAFLPYL